MKSKKDASRCEGNNARANTNGDYLKRALNWVLTDAIFADVRLHGNVNWTTRALVRLALFWVWSSEPGLVQAAQAAISLVLKLFGSVAVKSYQALTGALISCRPQLLPVLWRRLQGLMAVCGGPAWRSGQWLPLAVDGTRVGVPRTRSNEQRFCKPRRQHGKKKARRKKRGRHARRRHGPGQRHSKSHYDPQAVGPQVWLTLLWHIGLCLPWCWKLGPAYASERDHLQTLLQEQQFPETTLFCAQIRKVSFSG